MGARLESSDTFSQNRPIASHVCRTPYSGHSASALNTASAASLLELNVDFVESSPGCSFSCRRATTGISKICPCLSIASSSMRTALGIRFDRSAEIEGSNQMAPPRVMLTTSECRRLSVTYVPRSGSVVYVPGPCLYAGHGDSVAAHLLSCLDLTRS
jgi:hypothetical protein